MRNTFEIIGYFKEYYIGLKFIGKLTCKKDRDIYGYYGAKVEFLKENVKLDNNKTIKKGVECKTLLFPLNGKKL